MSYYCTRCKRVHTYGKIVLDHNIYDRAIAQKEYDSLKRNQEIYKQNKAKRFAVMDGLDKRIKKLKERKSDVQRQHSSSVNRMMYRMKMMRELKEKLKKK